MKDYMVSMMYEIRWEEETPREKWVDMQDFPLMKHLSDWVCDLTSANIDGWGRMECEW